MSHESKRRRVAEALTVRWTPALAARVERRLGEAIRRRRRRRRLAVVGLALLSMGGASFAFTRAREFLRGRHATVGARPALCRSGTAAEWPAVGPATLPATQPARGPEIHSQPASLAPAPETRLRQTPHRRLAVAPIPPMAAPRPESVSSLFAAADAARLAGRPADAVAPLGAIVAGFPADSRAAIAAFQLGRVLADELHDPAAAAQAFERAHDLAPGGPLAKDATTRAIESRRAVRASGKPGTP